MFYIIVESFALYNMTQMSLALDVIMSIATTYPAIYKKGWQDERFHCKSIF